MNNFNNRKLFLGSKIALIATAMTFAIRANLMGTLGNEFQISPTDMGIVVGTAFWGFTISMLIGGFLCDQMGIKQLLYIAFIGHFAGIILTIFSTNFIALFFSTLIVGIANGMVEAACNPLVATLYPNQKIKKINEFHVWFPGGIVIGGLTAHFLNNLQVGWQIQMATILIPTGIYGVLLLGEKFPKTERVSKGISFTAMIKECGRPLFLFMVFCMLLTASTELGTNQWIVKLLSNLEVSSILLLVFINGLMAIGRMFAGKIEHRISSSGILFASAIFSTIGLILLGNLTGYWSFLAAAIFALGICFFWPTMLGFVSENIPKTGALGLSVMGASGMLSVALVLPLMGQMYEKQIIANVPQGYTWEQLKNAVVGSTEFAILKSVQLTGGASTLQYLAIMPFALSVFFGILYFNRNLIIKK
jgi:MFS family permease